MIVYEFHQNIYLLVNKSPTTLFSDGRGKIVT